jgi:hypothetical protein
VLLVKEEGREREEGRRRGRGKGRKRRERVGQEGRGKGKEEREGGGGGGKRRGRGRKRKRRKGEGEGGGIVGGVTHIRSSKFLGVIHVVHRHLPILHKSVALHLPSQQQFVEHLLVSTGQQLVEDVVAPLPRLLGNDTRLLQEV